MLQQYQDQALKPKDAAVSKYLPKISYKCFFYFRSKATPTLFLICKRDSSTRERKCTQCGSSSSNQSLWSRIQTQPDLCCDLVNPSRRVKQMGFTLWSPCWVSPLLIYKFRMQMEAYTSIKASHFKNLQFFLKRPSDAHFHTLSKLHALVGSAPPPPHLRQNLA